MMKKVCIITIYGNFNYGNKLQNYALQSLLSSIIDVNTIKNKPRLSVKEKIFISIKKSIKNVLPIISKKYSYMFYDKKRNGNFCLFDNYLLKNNNFILRNNVNKKMIKNYDYYIVGSDQVWNPDFDYPFGEIKSLFLLDFVKDNNKKIAFSASFGVDKLPKEAEEQVKKYISQFKALSVREESGKKIIEDLTGRKDVIVLVDPTMLLTTEEWDKVSKKPEQIDKLCPNGEKYILNYFLGNLSEERKKEIERVAQENNCKIINILDKKDPFYVSGPSEFIWLEKHAFLICTDSFHSSVFAILYKRPFIVFNRDDGQNGVNSMNSRLETLLDKFGLQDRYYNGKITKELLLCDYSHTDEILRKEREKADEFLKNALK